MLFDSHSHLNEEDFTEEEMQARIEEIEKDKDLEYVMDIGCDIPTSEVAIRHAKENSWCYATAGVHPHGADEVPADYLDTLREMAKEEKVMAIGEIGLDFHYDNSARDAQRNVFREQIRLAVELEMPIVIHSREADQEVLDILKEEGAFSEARKAMFAPRDLSIALEELEEGDIEDWEDAEASAGVLLHCFSGSAELGREYVKLGADLSVAGPITYKGNKKTPRVVGMIPSCFLLAETDAPYLSPVPMRGKPNKSAYVAYTIEKMAEIKDLAFEDVAYITRENAKRFYRI